MEFRVFGFGCQHKNKTDNLKQLNLNKIEEDYE